MTGTDRCATPGCPGDGRYSAPGRGHVEGCRHPVPPPGPAVTAAAEALCRDRQHSHVGPFCVVSLIDCQVAVAAARPIIEAEKEAEVRERIAAEIEASCLLHGHYFWVTSDGTEPTVCGRCADAAVVARGTA